LARSLAHAGLHIVDAHERAVLDAMADVPVETLEYMRDDRLSPLEMKALATAELGRRAAKEGK
jgi:hypothetical protein